MNLEDVRKPERERTAGTDGVSKGERGQKIDVMMMSRKIKILL